MSKKLRPKNAPQNGQTPQVPQVPQSQPDSFEEQDAQFFDENPHLERTSLDRINVHTLVTIVQKDCSDLVNQELVEPNKFAEFFTYLVLASFKPDGLGRYWYNQEAKNDDASRAKLFAIANFIDSLFFFLFVGIKTVGWGSPLVAFYVAWLTGNVLAQESAKPGRGFVGLFNIARSFGLSLGGGLYFVTMFLGNPIAQIAAQKQVNTLLPQVQKLAKAEETSFFGGTAQQFTNSCRSSSALASRQATIKTEAVGKQLFTENTLVAYGTYENSKRLQSVIVAEGSLAKAVYNGTITLDSIQGDCYKKDVAKELSLYPKWRGPNMLKLQQLQGVKGLGSQLYILGGDALINKYQLTKGASGNLGVERIVDPYVEVSTLVSNLDTIWEDNFYALLMSLLGTIGITAITAVLTWYYSSGGKSYWAYRSHTPVGLDGSVVPRLKAISAVEIIVEILSDEALGDKTLAPRVLQVLKKAFKKTIEDEQWLPKAMNAMMAFLQQNQNFRGDWELVPTVDKDAAYKAIKAYIPVDETGRVYSACVVVVDFDELTPDEKMQRAFEIYNA